MFKYLYWKVIRPEMCLFFAQLFSFLCSALCFPEISSLTSLLSSLYSMLNFFPGAEQGIQRAEFEKPMSWAREGKEHIEHIIDMILAGILYSVNFQKANVTFMVHIYFKVVVQKQGRLFRVKMICKRISNEK